MSEVGSNIESSFQAIFEQLSKLSTGPEELRKDVSSRQAQTAALQEPKKDMSIGQDEHTANE